MRIYGTLTQISAYLLIKNSCSFVYSLLDLHFLYWLFLTIFTIYTILHLTVPLRLYVIDIYITDTKMFCILVLNIYLFWRHKHCYTQHIERRHLNVLYAYNRFVLFIHLTCTANPLNHHDQKFINNLSNRFDD